MAGCRHSSGHYAQVVHLRTDRCDRCGADDIAAGADPFESEHCVGVGSAGCDSGEAFCDPPNDVFEDHEYFRSVSQLIHHAFIQGRVYCDGLVNNNGVFDPGEEQPNTTVSLYEDLVPLGDGDIFLPPSQLSSDPDGFYQFEVSLDTDGDGAIDRDDYTVTAGIQEVAFTDMGAHETRVINIDICP